LFQKNTQKPTITTIPVDILLEENSSQMKNTLKRSEIKVASCTESDMTIPVDILLEENSSQMKNNPIPPHQSNTPEEKFSSAGHQNYLSKITGENFMINPGIDLPQLPPKIKTNPGSNRVFQIGKPSGKDELFPQNDTETSHSKNNQGQNKTSRMIRRKNNPRSKRRHRAKIKETHPATKGEICQMEDDPRLNKILQVDKFILDDNSKKSLMKNNPSSNKIPQVDIPDEKFLSTKGNFEVEENSTTNSLHNNKVQQFLGKRRLDDSKISPTIYKLAKTDMARETPSQTKTVKELKPLWESSNQIKQEDMKDREGLPINLHDINLPTKSRINQKKYP